MFSFGMCLSCSGADSSSAPLDEVHDAGTPAGRDAGPVDPQLATDAMVRRADAAQADGSSTEADAAVLATAEQGCPSSRSICAADPAGRWRVLLSASDVGAGAKFIAFGGGAVLAQTADGSFQVWQVQRRHAYGMPATVSHWSFPQADLRGIDVTDTPAEEEGVFALACSQAGCQLLHGDSGGGTLSLLAQLPGEEPSGLALGNLSGNSGVACVYGAGLACYVAGSWTNLIEGVRVRDVQLLNSEAYAVSENGELWLAERDELGRLQAFQRRAEFVGATSSLQSGSWRASIVASGGLLRWQDARLTACPPQPALQSAYLQTGLRNEQALTADWRVLSFQPVGGDWAWCEAQVLEPHGETALEHGSARCDDSVNPRVLTGSELIGFNECLSVL